MTSAIPVQYSTNWAIKPLGAGHFGSSLYTHRKWRIQMNIQKFIYLNCGEWYEDMIDHCCYAHNLSSYEIKAWKKIWKKFRPEWDSNSWLLRYWCSALPTELSSHWELATLWVCYIPIESEEYNWIYKSSYIWTAENDMKMRWSIISSYHSPQFKYMNFHIFICISGICCEIFFLSFFPIYILHQLCLVHKGEARLLASLP